MDTLTKILNKMKEQHISQRQLASYLGKNENVFNKWKRGDNSSYLKCINEISKYLNVSSDYLLNDDEEKIKVYDEQDNIVVIDDETREIIDTLRTNPEMKILFSVSKKATKEDIRKTVEIIKALSKTDNNNDD